IPPSTVYRPVSSTTATVPIQKLLNVAPPTRRATSGNRVAKTTPPAKIATANLVSTCAARVITDSTHRAVGEKRRPRNSGMVYTSARAYNGTDTHPSTH